LYAKNDNYLILLPDIACQIISPGHKTTVARSVPTFIEKKYKTSFLN